MKEKELEESHIKNLWSIHTILKNSAKTTKVAHGNLSLSYTFGLWKGSAKYEWCDNNFKPSRALYIEYKIRQRKELQSDPRKESKTNFA